MVESYRVNDQVRHETILNLGTLEELPEVEQKKLLGQRINDLMRQSVTGKTNLYVDTDELTEQLAQKFFQEIKKAPSTVLEVAAVGQQRVISHRDQGIEVRMIELLLDAAFWLVTRIPMAICETLAWLWNRFVRRSRT